MYNILCIYSIWLWYHVLSIFEKNPYVAWGTLPPGHSPLLYHRHRFWVHSYGEINAGFADLVWKENDTWAAHLPSEKLLALPRDLFEDPKHGSGIPEMVREPSLAITHQSWSNEKHMENTTEILTFPILRDDLGLGRILNPPWMASWSSIHKESITSPNLYGICLKSAGVSLSWKKKQLIDSLPMGFRQIVRHCLKLRISVPGARANNSWGHSHGHAEAGCEPDTSPALRALSWLGYYV